MRVMIVMVCSSSFEFLGLYTHFRENHPLQPLRLISLFGPDGLENKTDTSIKFRNN